MQELEIRYKFKLEDGQEENFRFQLDQCSLETNPGWRVDLPEWTRLEFHQCGNCPLELKPEAHCPAAVNMAELVSRFTALLSHDRTTVIVSTCERVVSMETTIQRGICSLMGLLMATSRCPMTSFFKPMARFHLPFASTQETIWRATSTYLLAQYFKQQDGNAPDLLFEGLSRIYNDIQIVNLSFAKRLRAACHNDSMVNAIILLDMFAQSMPSAIDESLEEIRHLFVPYLAHSGIL
jgi:Domain of unknown function (DUF6901)